MLGVTKTMRAGVSAEEAARHGRWKSKDMPLRYAFNATETKVEMAAKVPFQ